MKNCLLTGVLAVLICNTAISQRVGIGTNTPVEKLHVAGNIKADTVKPGALRLTSNAGEGKVLTSDAAGNARWQQLTSNAAQGTGSWGDCSMNGVTDYQPVGDPEAATNDYLGFSVAISGEFAIAGSPFDDVGANADQGSASVFRFNGGSWELMQKITDASGAAGDYFGNSVSISGNYLVIGTVADDVNANINQGTASVYQYNGSNWVFVQRLTDPSGSQGDLFGHKVSIDGNFIVIGANEDDMGANIDQGSACVFQRTGSTWSFMQKLSDVTGASEDLFGISVAVSGNNIIVGASYDDIGAGTNQGSVLFYFFNGSSWVLRNKLTDANGATDDNFGYTVSISGNYAIVGSPFHDLTHTDQGSVSVYSLVGNNWTFMQRFNAESPSSTEGYGFSVAISGDYIMIGAPLDDVGTMLDNKGTATIYKRIGLGWGKLQLLVDKMGVPDDQFGSSVAIDQNTSRFVSGVHFYAGTSGKIVFGKVL